MTSHARRNTAGYSLAELSVVMALITLTSAVAAPRLLVALDDLRTLGAVRYMSSTLQQARMEAVVRHTDVAVRFASSGASYDYAMYADGNGNGLKSREISEGTDPEIRRQQRLSDQFAGVDFGALAGLPPVDSSSAAPGADPIRLGSSNLATFSPIGTSTSGSLYIRGRRNAQYTL